MLYEVKDPLLGNGSMQIAVLALADTEGMIIKTQFVNVSSQSSVVLGIGGASGKKFSRDGDIGADPESSFYLKPDYCKDNSYSIQQEQFSFLVWQRAGCCRKMNDMKFNTSQRTNYLVTLSKKLKQLSADCSTGIGYKINRCHATGEPADHYIKAIHRPHPLLREKCRSQMAFIIF